MQMYHINSVCSDVQVEQPRLEAMLKPEGKDLPTHLQQVLVEQMVHVVNARKQAVQDPASSNRSLGNKRIVGTSPREKQDFRVSSQGLRQAGSRRGFAEGISEHQDFHE